GETKLSNLVLICSSHHRLIHEGRLRVEGAGEGKARFVVLDELGRELPWVPGSGGGERELVGLEGWLRDVGVRVDAAVSEPRWDGSRMRLGECVAGLLASPGFGVGL
ncbi:MAG: HNH endonuclease, partial [Myxococcales bacterium]|nr:HNH endonuclease [Myxococcales bacterium]